LIQQNQATSAPLPAVIRVVIVVERRSSVTATGPRQVLLPFSRQCPQCWLHAPCACYSVGTRDVVSLPAAVSNWCLKVGNGVNSFIAKSGNENQGVIPICSKCSNSCHSLTAVNASRPQLKTKIVAVLC